MAECIDRQKAIEQIKAEWAKLPLTETSGFGILMRVLNSIPAADVRPVARGKWERTSKSLMACSVCGNCVVDDRISGMFFCPNCGADMREES